jgi:hypothetical protein
VKRIFLQILISITLLTSFSGCAEAVAEGVMRGTAQLAMEAGIKEGLRDKDNNNTKPLFQCGLGCYKMKSWFSYGPLAKKN